MEEKHIVDISVVIPVFNAENTLDELIIRLIKVLISLGVSYEIIFVNDGSKDGSWNKLKKFYHKEKHVIAINLMKNFGQHNAVLCGLNHCNGDYVITMDDDLQNPPEEIPRLINHIKDNPDYDVIIGVPIQPMKSSIKKMGSDLLNYIISKIINKPIHIRMASFRVMSRILVNQLKLNQTKTPTIGGMIYEYTRHVGNIYVEHVPRSEGKSGYTIRNAFKLFLNFLLNYSRLPLRFASYLGFISSLIGFCLAIFYLIKYLFGTITIPGWTTLVILVLILGGLILLTLGILGEYLYRVIGEVNHTPQYVVRDRLL